MAADEPRHEPAESIRPQDTPGEKREAAPRMPAIVAEVDPSPTNPTKPDQEGKPPSWTFKDWLEVIAVLTAIGLLIVNICQSRSNEKAAVATQKSVEHADRNFRIDERAWIELEHIETQRLQAPPSWHGGGLLVLRVSLKNYGKTSGRNLVIQDQHQGHCRGKSYRIQHQRVFGTSLARTRPQRARSQRKHGYCEVWRVGTTLPQIFRTPADD